MRTKLVQLIATALFLALSPEISRVNAQSTDFTYQGRLTDSAGPANGIYDLRFALYDSGTDGSLAAGPVTNAAVSVTNGLFTASVDFGSGAFTGAVRWLEIGVRANSSSDFTSLSPRQMLSSVPYAQYAASAVQAFTVPSGAITSAMLADGAVTSNKLGLAAVKVANIDDEGRAVYEEFLGATKHLSSSGNSLPFEDLFLVSMNNGAAPAFSFRLDGAAFGTVLGFVGREAMSEPFEYVVDVLAPKPDLDPSTQLGRQGAFFFVRNGTSSSFAGFITGCSISSYEGGGARYTFRIGPALAWLALSRDYHLYQNMDLPTLVSVLYTNSLTLSLVNSHPPHELQTQFGESTLNFLSRLLEEEGVFYFFGQSGASRGLVLGDSAGAYRAAPYDALLYSGDASTNRQPADERILSFQKATRDSVKTATLRNYDFTAPRLDLTVSDSAAEGRGEDYQFGWAPKTRADLVSIARVRSERHAVERNTRFGTANAPDLRPGYTFMLRDATDAGVGDTYLVTAVQHGAFRRTVGKVSSLYYGNRFEVIPAVLPFRPADKTPKPVAQASTAVVTGPTGEEVFTDSNGRVKVRFHWDRYGANDQTASAWIRVASQWAGQGFGMFFLPRVGQEVMVDFVNGDPDEPVVTGSLFNTDQTPPYSLPAQKTVSGIRTRSTNGGTLASGNEIRFEDKLGAEELYFKAQRDFNVNGGNDASLTFNHDLMLLAGNDAKLSAGNGLSFAAAQGVAINAPVAANVALNVGGAVNATSFSGNGSGLTGITAGGLADGSVTSAKLAYDVNSLSKVSGGFITVDGGGRVVIDAANVNNGSVTAAALNFGAGSGEGIASKRTAGTGQYGLDFYTSFLPRLTIDNAGRVGIGKSSPGYALDVNGTVAATGFSLLGDGRLNDHTVYLRGGSDTLHGVGWYASGTWGGWNPDGPVLFGCGGGGLGAGCGATGQTLALVWNELGRVGIGRTPLNNRLEVEGTASKTTSGSWLANSDARIKTDVTTITNALETLERVRPVTFRYTDDYRSAHPCIEDHAYFNVIAQEFCEVFPDSVRTSGEKLADGSEILQVDTYPLTIYSAAAIQELNLKLEQQVADKEAKIAKLETEMSELKSMVLQLSRQLESSRE